MTRSARAALAVALLVLVSAAPAAAQPSASYSAGAVSRYHWRGYVLADRPAFQGSVSAAVPAGPGGLSISVWGSAAAAGRDALGVADEVDVTVAYEGAAGPVGYSAGLTYYTFPNQVRFAWADHATPELFVRLSPALPLGPTLGAAYDLHLGDGLYVDLGLGHEAQAGSVPLSLGAAAGYNGGQFGAEPGLAHLDLSVSAAVPAGVVAVRPSATVTRSFENTGRPGTYVLFGLSVSR